MVSKSRPRRGILSGPSEADSIGDQVRKHRQVVVTFGPLHLIGSHPQSCRSSVVHAQHSRGQKHLPHPKVALAEDLTGALKGLMTHQGKSKTSNYRMKHLLRSSHSGVMLYTLRSLPRCPGGRAPTIAYSLWKMLRCRHRTGLIWSWQITGVSFGALSSGHNAAVFSSLITNVEEHGPSCVPTPRQTFPRISNCPNSYCGVTAGSIQWLSSTPHLHSRYR